jgi:tetratricopeptide (TPR) repeat protein
MKETKRLSKIKKSQIYRCALDDFNWLIDLDPTNANASFFKAKSLKKLKNYDDAVLWFEQVLKLANEEYLQENAIYEIVKI